MRILKVKIRPNAAKSEMKGEMADGTLKIDIAAAPEKGRANKELVRLLAEELKVDKDDLSIISGKSSRDKTIKIK